MSEASPSELSPTLPPTPLTPEKDHKESNASSQDIKAKEGIEKDFEWAIAHLTCEPLMQEDLQKAFKYLQEAAERGLKRANAYLSCPYYQGILGFEKNTTKGKRLAKEAEYTQLDYYNISKILYKQQAWRLDFILKAINPQDKKIAQQAVDLFIKMDIEINNKDLDKYKQPIIQAYTLAADGLGNARAQVVLGYYYKRKSEYYVQADEDNSKKYFMLAAVHGNIAAIQALRKYDWLCELAYAYSHWSRSSNRLVNQDPNKVFLWATVANNSKEPRAAQLLGECYYLGLGTAKNLELAKDYFLKALNGEDIHKNIAQFYLGKMHLQGEAGLPENRNQAIKYFTAAGKLEAAQVILKTLKSSEKKFSEINEQLTSTGEKSTLTFSSSSPSSQPVTSSLTISPHIKDEDEDADKKTNLTESQLENTETEIKQKPSARISGDDEYYTYQYVEAAALYKDAADKEPGDPNAQFKLAKMLLTGKSNKQGDNEVKQDLKQAVRYLKLAADKDLAEAQYVLGNCYVDGLVSSEEQNYQENNTNTPVKDSKNEDLNLRRAFELYKKAADLGHPAANTSVGYCYAMGRGVEKDSKEAIRYYQAADKQKDPKGQALLGMCYQYGQGVPVDLKEAKRLYTASAQKGNAEGLFQWAVLHLTCEFVGSQEDMELALDYLQQAADKGFKRANGYLSCFYSNVLLGFKKDTQKGEQLDKQAEYTELDYYNLFKICIIHLRIPAGYFGFQESYYTQDSALKYIEALIKQSSGERTREVVEFLITNYHDPFVYPETLSLYKLAAEKNWDKAQAVLGAYYLSAADNSRPPIIGPYNINQAKKYFIQAASQGNFKALDVIYQRGWLLDFAHAYSSDAQDPKLTENPSQVFRWTKEAYDRDGNTEAAQLLGKYYYEGYGTPKNLELAKEYFEQAAKKWRNNDLAKYYLGIMHINGEGFPKDIETGKKYLNSVASTVPAAKSLLEKLGPSSEAFSWSKLMTNFGVLKAEFKERRGNPSINSESINEAISNSTMSKETITFDS